MKKAMDIFGEAIYSFWKGDKSKFYLLDQKNEKSLIDFGRYFRNYKQLSRIEKKLISLSYGNILDIGCATGYYVPFLMKNGKVVAIDISSKLIKIAQENGLRNCQVADIFKFKPKRKFDTITLLENGLGMAGKVNRVKDFLKTLVNLLEKDGQILLISRRIENKDFFEVELRPFWKEKIGAKFKWVHLNISFITKLCREINLNLKIIDKDEFNYLSKITRQ